jgi:RimJ/RimL family protein N-acetyltransferase
VLKDRFPDARKVGADNSAEMLITTERLEIRPIEKDDCEAVHRYAGDPSIDMMMFLPNESIEETKKFVDFAVSEWKKEEPEDMEFAVLLNGEIIGGVNLEKCGDGRTYEIGWTIRKDMRGKGYASEAAKALMDHAFEELNAETVQAHCDSRNVASEKVMRKLGMTLIDDTGTRYYPKTGISSGEYLYAIKKN